MLKLLQQQPHSNLHGNILLISRTKPLATTLSAALLDSNFLFRHMQCSHMLNDRDQTRKHFVHGTKMSKRSQVIEILCIENQFVICLL
jgi:hypothetical protein